MESRTAAAALVLHQVYSQSEEDRKLGKMFGVTEYIFNYRVWGNYSDCHNPSDLSTDPEEEPDPYHCNVDR